MGFKKISVLVDIYEMSKGKTVKIENTMGDAILTDRIYSLDKAIKNNNEYNKKRRWVEINWVKTLELQIEAGNLDWLDYALDLVEYKCRGLKDKIGFPMRDSYTQRVSDLARDGKTLGDNDNQFIGTLEKYADILKAMEVKPAKKKAATKPKED